MASRWLRDASEGYKWNASEGCFEMASWAKTAKTKKYGVRYQMISYIMHQESPGIAWNGPELSGIARNCPEFPGIAKVSLDLS